MAFPPRDPNAPPRPKAPPKGKASSKRYAIAWVMRSDPSNDDSTWHWDEVKSTNVTSAFTALVKKINATRATAKTKAGREPIRKTQLVLLEATVMQRGDTIEMFQPQAG